MLAQEYYQLNQSVRNQNIIFSFSGYVSERLLFSLGEILKQKLALEETNLNTPMCQNSCRTPYKKVS